MATSLRICVQQKPLLIEQGIDFRGFIPAERPSTCRGRSVPGGEIQSTKRNAQVEIAEDQLRAWPFGGDNKESATDEFYILERYGNFFAHLRATCPSRNC
jgi:lysozyme family protein